MNKVILFLILTAMITGCTFNVSVITPQAPDPDNPTPGPSQLTPTPMFTYTPYIPTPTFTPVPPFTDPIFMNARTSTTPDESNVNASFPAGTKAVYALWEYHNMRPGLTVRREWYWNDQLWLKREEPWNFGKYGSDGTMRDISIYDNETGLNSGLYQLRLFIDNVQQPIGSVSPIQPWITFEIGADEPRQGYASPDFQWGVTVIGEKRILLQDRSGNSREIYTAREVPYVSWFNDSKHFLFVDRDRSGQKPGTTIGIRDALGIVDVASGAVRMIYQSDTSFGGRGGPVASPDGKYIASVHGSGFADACSVDSNLVFFQLTEKFDVYAVIQQGSFAGLPAFNEGWIYPVEDGYWVNPTTYHVVLDGTCNADRSKLGPFTFDVLNRTAKQAISPTRVPGDLGTGMIHGTITDASTGAPIQNASVSCEQHSYTNATPCSGTVLTNANGEYAFNNVFFHDTDTITLTVQATGYQTQKYSTNSFTTNDWKLDLKLDRLP